MCLQSESATIRKIHYTLGDKNEIFTRVQIVVDIESFGYFEELLFIAKRRIQTHAKRATKGR